MRFFSYKQNMAFLLLWGVCCIILFQYFSVMYYSWAGDAAGFVDTLHNIADGKGMVSSAFSSIYSLMPYLNSPLDYYSNADYKSLHYMQDFSEWHPYLIAYLLASFQFFGLSALQVASGYMALTLSGTLFLMAYFLRRYNVNSLYVLVFIGIVFFYPPFSGNIVGQFYFDRFFIFHELFLLFLLHVKFADRKSVPYWLIGVVFVLTVLISERTAIMSSLSVLAFFLFYWKTWSFKEDYNILLLPFFGFLYVLIYMYAFQHSPYYSQISFSSLIITFLTSMDFTTASGQKTLIFLMTLLPFILLSLFNWKYLFLALMTILPNLIITIGGAEKIHFSTHYHDMYLPFLLFSSTMGMLKVYEWKTKLKYPVLSIVIVLAIASNYIHYENNKAVFNIKSQIFGYSQILPNSSKNKILQNNRDFFTAFFADIPHEAKVSALEYEMPSLVLRGLERIDYFPVGLNDNEYLVIEYVGEQNDSVPEIVSFVADANERKKIALFLQSKISDNFTIEKKAFYLGKNFVIYKRIPKDK